MERRIGRRDGKAERCSVLEYDELKTFRRRSGIGEW